MAKTMSIIRYKYKADRDFESVQFEGTSCSLGELKRLIVEKSSRSGTHHPRDDYDLIISNATTFEEYKDNSDLISRNTSVVVARRIRGTFESLTPSNNQKLVISSDDIVNEYLRPAIFHPTSLPTSSASSIVESKGIPLEMLTPPSNNLPTEELSEEERIKQLVKTSQSRYLPAHRSYTCHHCKQPGHLRHQCPVLLQSSSTNATGSSSSSGGDQTTKADSTQPTGSSSASQPVPSHPSHIITSQSPYQISHHHSNHYHGNRPYYRASGFQRRGLILKKPTGIPRGSLIPVPRPIAGAMTDQSGASFVPWQMAQLIVERSERETDALAQRNRQFQEKGVLPPAPPTSMLPNKSADEEAPPGDLLCPICKRVYTDAVIAPCCHNSFCDECIRTALVENEDHECPQCHRQHVAIGQINPNLFLRNYVNRWHEERQHKSSYPSYMSFPQQTSTMNYLTPQITDQDLDPTSTRTSGSTNAQDLNDVDEYDAALLSTNSQPSVAPIRTAPIVIRMQPAGRSPSPPQAFVLTKPADMTFEDGKAPDADPATSSQKDMHSQLSATSNGDGRSSNTLSDPTISESETSDRQTPPSQVAPISTILSSPPTTTTTTMAGATSVVPHYYPSPSHILPPQQHMHPGMMYPQQFPPTSATGLYPMQPHFYSAPMHVPYPGVHHSVRAPPSMLPFGGPPVPSGGMHHYPGHPSYPPAHHHHHHPMGHPHLPPNQLNGYHVAHFEAANVSSPHHPNAAFAATSTSTVIAHQHHQTSGQPIATSALSKDEFYIKQRHLQRIHRSTSRHRHSRSRSSSSSSYASSDSRSSSFSRRDHRQHPRRQSSRSRSRERVAIRLRRRDNNHTTSPNHQQQRRSPSNRSRGRAPLTKDNHSSNHRRPSPRRYRSTREQERRRSPRPPPTIQQSTQRTIVYMHESSSSGQHSNRDHHRTKSRSRHHSRPNDDRAAPSSKTKQQSQSESLLSSSPMTVPSDQQRTTLSSTIATVTEEHPSDNPLLTETNSNNRSNDTTEDKNSNSEKKRKKHHHRHHPKKHRRHRSKSKKRDHSKDNDSKSTVDDTAINSARVIEA